MGRWRLCLLEFEIPCEPWSPSTWLARGFSETYVKASQIYPARLDIGGETAVEVALSIVAAIRAVLGMRGGGGLLRNRPGRIHGNEETDELSVSPW